MRMLLGILLLSLSLSQLVACKPGGALGLKNEGDTKLSKQHSKDARTRVQLGIQYLRGKNYSEALRVLNEAAERYPDLPGPISALALVYEQVGDVKSATSAFDQAVDLDPNDAAIRNNYANFLCRESRYEEAQQQFEAGFKDRLYKDPAQLHTNAGRCALRVPDLGLAEIEFRKALSVAPNYRAALYEMAGISLKLRRYRAGLSYLDRSTKGGQHSASSLWMGVRLARGAKDQQRELRFARDLSLQFPNSPEAELLLR